MAVDPPQVTVSGTLRARTVEGRIKTVPIKLMISNDMTERLQVVFGGQEGNIVTRELLIRGPAEVVRALEDGTSGYDVLGFVEVSSADERRELVEGENILKTPQFINLPPEVQQAADVEQVEIRLVTRPAMVTP